MEFDNYTREKLRRILKEIDFEASGYDWGTEEFEFLMGLCGDIEDALESLTLADFLGWEEGVEYEYYPAQSKESAKRAKIVDNIFYRFIPSVDEFGAYPIYPEDIPNMKQAERSTGV